MLINTLLGCPRDPVCASSFIESLNKGFITESVQNLCQSLKMYDNLIK